MKLCNTCYNLDTARIVGNGIRRWDSSSWKEFDIPIASLNQSSLDGCKTCTVILQADIEAEGPISQDMSFQVCVPVKRGPVQVTRLVPEQNNRNCFELYTLSGLVFCSLSSAR